MVTTRSLPSRSAKPQVIVGLVVALVLGTDQVSKQWALTTLGQVGMTLVLPGTRRPYPRAQLQQRVWSGARVWRPYALGTHRAEPDRRVRPGWSCASARNS